LFSRRIQEILYPFYDRLPPRVRAFVSSVVPVFFFLKRGLFFLSQFRLPVYLLEGKEKWGGDNLAVVFLGDEKGVLFLSNLLYSGEPATRNLGKVFIWRIKSRLNLDLPRIDLIFIKLDGLFSRWLGRRGFIIMPEWVLFMINLSRPLRETWNLSKKRNKSLRENLRRIKKDNYSYELTQEPGKFGYFYYQMYLPYVTKRFEELTLLTSFREMERAFKKGQLLLVKRGDRYVSGNVVRVDHDHVIVPYLGITEGRIEYLKAGALTALYYFTILWAKEGGYRWIDFGHSRSLLKDGSFKFKKHWGMEIKMSARLRDVFGIRICNFHPGVQSFLERNPFVFIDEGKLKGLVLAAQNHPLTLGEVQSFVKSGSIPGLDCLTILSDQGFAQEAVEFSFSHQGLHLISKKPDAFFEAFPYSLRNVRSEEKTV